MRLSSPAAYNCFRAHGLIRKLPRTHRYQLAKRGRVLITALLTAHAASTRKLIQIAA